jgi:hypothetical protein
MKRLSLIIVLALLPFEGRGVSGDRFVWAQVERSGRWDPYPELWDWAAVFLRQTTRLDPVVDRRVLRILDDALFDSPFLVVTGRGALGFSDQEIVRIRSYLASGGFLFLDDTAASASSPFAQSVRLLPHHLSGGSHWLPIPEDHALYRSFFLLRSAGGRRRVDDRLWGYWMGDRLVAVWSANDLLGALARDRLGRPLFECDPGGETQREESVRLLVNIVMFSVTGTYKTDAVHQPFLKKKLGP